MAKGASDNVAIVTGLPALTFDGSQEFPSFAFGAADKVVTDFIVTDIDPQGAQVRISGVVYNEDIYHNSFPHLLQVVA